MAITIEQQKKSVNWFGILLVVVILLVILGGGYFLFFKKPELIDVVAPGNLGDLQKLSEIQLKPGELFNSPEFKLLKQYSTTLDLPNPGRDNPFKPIF